ncbi:MAG: arylsulfatase family protein [Verrucomicrobiales bacterium]|nr:arylsulfatase family protein [Verrucomicrobiales bacterium]
MHSLVSPRIFFVRLLALSFLAAAAFSFLQCKGRAAAAEAANSRPNIVLIFCDDLAYGDLASYGNKKAKTPNLDRMAAEGMRFTDFYVGQPVCSASRAALLTGCYPNRVGIQGALPPRARTGLNPREITIAEILKERGYATAIYGKWHLGDSPECLPTRQGFDEYFGLPYSNDMWPNHPTSGTNYPPLPLFENEKVVELMPDQTKLTTWYTERAVKFIEKNKERPFFLYLPHSMPHVPLHVSDKHKGKSGSGLYGDVIMEIDWSVGEILKTLKQNGLDEKTLVMFSSDNGPWLLYGNHAGDARPLREGKMTSFEGGVREPFIARWPGRIPAGKVSHELATAMDLLPTFARVAGGKVPADRIIDGKDIWPLLSGEPEAKSPHKAYYYYWGDHLQAVRSGPWKLHLPHEYASVEPAGKDGKPGKNRNRLIGLELFNLEADPGETTDVSDRNSDVMEQLEKLAEACRLDLGDSATKTKGKGVREPARISPIVAQAQNGNVLLHSRDVSIHGINVRYEPQTNKNTIGFWTRKEDWVSWDFEILKPGTFEVEILQGCGKGSGGSEVDFAVGDQVLPITVQDTGHFQNFVPRVIGKYALTKAGQYTLSVKPRTKPGVAVMDLRQVMLKPTRE